MSRLDKIKELFTFDSLTETTSDKKKNKKKETKKETKKEVVEKVSITYVDPTDKWSELVIEQLDKVNKEFLIENWEESDMKTKSKGRLNTILSNINKSLTDTTIRLTDSCNCDDTTKNKLRKEYINLMEAIFAVE